MGPVTAPAFSEEAEACRSAARPQLRSCGALWAAVFPSEQVPRAGIGGFCSGGDRGNVAQAEIGVVCVGHTFVWDCPEKHNVVVLKRVESPPGGRCWERTNHRSSLVIDTSALVLHRPARDRRWLVLVGAVRRWYLTDRRASLQGQDFRDDPTQLSMRDQHACLACVISMRDQHALAHSFSPAARQCMPRRALQCADCAPTTASGANYKGSGNPHSSKACSPSCFARAERVG
eukprot:gene11782-biopygen22917